MENTSDKFFNLSLGDWLGHCQTVGVPYIPATRISDVPVRDLYKGFDGIRTESVDTMYKEFTQYMQDHPGHMWRWDCCSSEDLKHDMAKGGKPGEKSFKFLLDDCRLSDILVDWNRERLVIWGRPWWEALMHEGWPVELRVFTWEGKIIGCSNYYPQRPLPDHMLHLAHGAIKLANQLNFPCPSFTADFLVDSHGDLVFIEGGPPHTPTWGAHMCCFKPGEIDGIAFTERNEKRK